MDIIAHVVYYLVLSVGSMLIGAGMTRNSLPILLVGVFMVAADIVWRCRSSRLR